MSTDKPSRMATVTEHEAAQVERPATGNERYEQMDLKPTEFLQEEEKLWNLRQVDRMQTLPSSSSSSSGVMTPSGSTPAVTRDRILNYGRTLTTFRLWEGLAVIRSVLTR